MANKIHGGLVDVDVQAAVYDLVQMHRGRSVDSFNYKRAS
jgi:hypothetical protein